MHFEMIYRSIFICCSHNISGGPPISHRLSSLLGMSEIHFAISCPHVAKVCESDFYGGGHGGGAGEESRGEEGGPYRVMEQKEENKNGGKAQQTAESVLAVEKEVFRTF